MATLVVSLLCCAALALAQHEPRQCQVRARTESGFVCGSRRSHPTGQYASFQGIPYVTQPLGELRFQDLPPHEPWDEWDATAPGPICPQYDPLYRGLVTPTGMGEDCLRANVYVPIVAPADADLPPVDLAPTPDSQGLPILVFIHGGGYAFGSGDPDIYGPEYLVSKNVIVVTFNYRLNVFGFLSLQSRSVPGNAGLRDIIAVLKWVRLNAHHFGGNPDDITLAGQSAGASAMHLLSMSTAAEGLFQRGIMMSGTGARSFFSPSPAYADTVAKLFISSLGINSTDPEEIHKELVAIPIETITLVNRKLQEEFGLGVFYPTVETPFEGVTTIIDDDPEKLLSEGRGCQIPLIIGYTTNECEVFKKILQDINLLDKIKKNPLIMLPPPVVFTTPQSEYATKLGKVYKRYTKDAVTIDDFVEFCSDAYFKYPAWYAAEKRLNITNSAPTFVYQFSYNGHYRVFQNSQRTSFKGAAHIEDMTFVFKTKIGPRQRNISDSLMQDWMTILFTEFMRNYAPWSEVSQSNFEYQNIRKPGVPMMSRLTDQDLSRIEFYNDLYSNQPPLQSEDNAQSI